MHGIGFTSKSVAMCNLSLTQSAPHTLATVCSTHLAHAATVLSISPMMCARSAKIEGMTAEAIAAWSASVHSAT